MKKGKHIHRNITAKRSEHSICIDVTSTLKVGNKFRYKGYACTVDDITRKLVRFTGTRNEKVGEVTRQMILNVESFNSAVEERRIIFEKEEAKSNSTVLIGNFNSLSKRRGNLFHRRKNGIENGRQQILHNPHRAVQDGGRKPIRHVLFRRHRVRLQFAGDCVPFLPTIQKSIRHPGDLFRQV